MGAPANELIVQDTEDEVDELDSALEAIEGEGEQTDEETGKEEGTELEGDTEKIEEDPEKAGEEEGEEKDEKDADAESDPDFLSELRELRGVIRDQKRELALMKGRQDTASKVPARATDDLGQELDEEDQPKPEVSSIEQLNSMLTNIGEVRSGQLDLLAETMVEMPKYTDLYDICSKANFADIFDAIGKEISDSEGISHEEGILTAEIKVWQMPNPYKYMYNLIKEHHPNFAKKKEEAPKPSDKKDPEEKKDLKPADAPDSIAGKGGGDVKGGWTATKIDALSEEELDKVPTDIYKKYMNDELK